MIGMYNDLPVYGGESPYSPSPPVQGESKIQNGQCCGGGTQFKGKKHCHVCRPTVAAKRLIFIQRLFNGPELRPRTRV